MGDAAGQAEPRRNRQRWRQPSGRTAEARTARAQCKADLIASGVSGAKLEQAIDRYWIVVAAESSGGVGLFGDDERPADFDTRKREFLHLIGRRDRYSR